MIATPRSCLSVTVYLSGIESRPMWKLFANFSRQERIEAVTTIRAKWQADEPYKIH